MHIKVVATPRVPRISITVFIYDAITFRYNPGTTFPEHLIPTKEERLRTQDTFLKYPRALS
jgi:hypothetical protein